MKTRPVLPNFGPFGSVGKDGRDRRTQGLARESFGANPRALTGTSGHSVTPLETKVNALPIPQNRKWRPTLNIDVCVYLPTTDQRSRPREASRPYLRPLPNGRSQMAAKLKRWRTSKSELALSRLGCSGLRSRKCLDAVPPVQKFPGEIVDGMGPYVAGDDGQAAEYLSQALSADCRTTTCHCSRPFARSPCVVTPREPGKPLLLLPIFLTTSRFCPRLPDVAHFREPTRAKFPLRRQIELLEHLVVVDVWNDEDQGGNRQARQTWLRAQCYCLTCGNGMPLSRLKLAGSCGQSAVPYCVMLQP